MEQQQRTRYRTPSIYNTAISLFTERASMRPMPRTNCPESPIPPTSLNYLIPGARLVDLAIMDNRNHRLGNSHGIKFGISVNLSNPVIDAFVWLMECLSSTQRLVGSTVGLDVCLPRLPGKTSFRLLLPTSIARINRRHIY